MKINRFISKYLLNVFSGKIDYLIRNNSSVKFLENRLNKMVYDVYQNCPPYIIQTETVKHQIKKFRELHNIPEKLNTIVSKNDIMYHTCIQNIISVPIYLIANLITLSVFNENPYYLKYIIMEKVD